MKVLAACIALMATSSVATSAMAETLKRPSLSKPAHKLCTSQDNRFFGYGLGMMLYAMSKSVCLFGGPSHAQMWDRNLKARGCGKNTEIYSEAINEARLLDNSKPPELWFLLANANEEQRTSMTAEQVKSFLDKGVNDLGGCEKLKLWHLDLVKNYNENFPGLKK